MKPKDRSEGLHIYLREIGGTPLLSREEEVALAWRVQSGDADARDRMIRANLKLVVTIAAGYRNRGLPLMDLIAEGNRGLMKAVDRYRPDRGAKLSTYAAYWIRQAMSRALANQARTIRLPVHVIEKLGRIEKARRSIREELEHEPSDNELARRTGLEADKIGKLREASSPTVSLDAPASDRGEMTVSEVIADRSAVGPDEATRLSERLRELGCALEALDDRERIIIRERYGLGRGKGKTLDEVSRKLGVTRERVRQVQERVLEKMRWELRKREELAHAPVQRIRAEKAGMHRKTENGEELPAEKKLNKPKTKPKSEKRDEKNE